MTVSVPYQGIVDPKMTSTKMFQLMHMHYNEYDTRQTIGIYSDVNDLFKTIHDKKLNIHMEVYEIVPDKADRQLKLIWNNFALEYNNKIMYVAKGCEDIEIISDLRTKRETLQASVDEKKIMLKSLMNLNAKNTKAPASMSFILNPYFSQTLRCTGSTTYLHELRDNVRQLQYINYMLDEWIVDLVTETGYEGELSELVKEGKYEKVPAIAFP